MALKHKKVSLIADTEDTDLVRPSDWNAEHQVDAANVLLKADVDGNVVAATPNTDYATPLKYQTEAPANPVDGQVWIDKDEMVVTTNANITISTLNPSGGNDGDIWIKYIP